MHAMCTPDAGPAVECESPRNSQMATLADCAAFAYAQTDMNDAWTSTSRVTTHRSMIAKPVQITLISILTAVSNQVFKNMQSALQLGEMPHAVQIYKAKEGSFLLL